MAVVQGRAHCTVQPRRLCTEVETDFCMAAVPIIVRLNLQSDADGLHTVREKSREFRDRRSDF